MSKANTPEMRRTNMPGFTAEASLYGSKRRYLPRRSGGFPGTANIVPATLCCVHCPWSDDWCCEECKV